MIRLTLLTLSILLSLSTNVFGKEVFAQTTLQRGHIIGSVDIRPASEKNMADMELYIGKEVRRTIYAGAPLNFSLVAEPLVVKRNQRVSMVYRLGRLEITAFGRALEAGSAGETIALINVDTRQRIMGRIRANGVVEVSP